MVVTANSDSARARPSSLPASRFTAKRSRSNENGPAQLFRNKGDGTFNTPVNFPSAGTEVRSIAVADFNGDGRLDLALGNAGSLNVSILLGNGDGSFGTAKSYKVAGQPWSISVGDFNGDGRPDIAAIAIYNSVSLLLNKGGGAFADWISIPAGDRPREVLVRDVNGDGKMDLVVTNGDVTTPTSPYNYVTVLTNDCAAMLRRRPARH